MDHDALEMTIDSVQVTWAPPTDWLLDSDPAIRWQVVMDAVSISLTSDEALVLFDLLHRWENDDQVSAPQHQAEHVALWNLSALLERSLREPFESRYAELVSAARGRLTPSE